MKNYLFLGQIFIISFIQSAIIDHLPLCDKKNMFRTIYTFPEQMETAMQIGKDIQLRNNYTDIDHILFAGMGGSGMAGNMVKSLIQHDCPFPISIHKNYDIPEWVNEKTLVICLSYSGGTEETLSCFQAAQAKGAKIIGISSGGKLSDLLINNNLDLVNVPGGLLPRAALGYLCVPLLYLMKKIGATNVDPDNELCTTVAHLKNNRDLFCKKDDVNPAYGFAQKYSSLMPVIYGESETTGVVAQRWQGQFAENSKMIARTHLLPELNHNEIVGWQENTVLLKKSVVVWLLDSVMHPRNQVRQKFTQEIIGDMAFAHIIIQGHGQTWLQRMFYLIYLGDWISYWCAVKHNVDPSIIKNIDLLKEKMSDI